MFGVDSGELAIVAILALIFIGPKDLPKVMRTVGYWVGRVRGMARHFTSGIENMVREAELEEMEKKWREENTPKLGEEPMPESLTFKGPDFDDVKPHLWNFFQAVRSRKPVVEDALFGHHAALACHMANESYFRQQGVHWDASTKTIKS